jgi:hypothetical protein
VDPFYAVVKMIARFWIWFFFERVEVWHPERVPSEQPDRLAAGGGGGGRALAVVRASEAC